MSDQTFDAALHVIIDQVEARVIAGHPLALAELARLAATLRSVALIAGARRAASDADALLMDMVRRLGPAAPPSVPLPVAAASNIIPLRRRMRAHADHVQGDGDCA
jgi:hypothetical protein